MTASRTKTDPVNGEVFECSGGEGHCWCFDLPPVGDGRGEECLGPTRLKKRVEEKMRDRSDKPTK